MQYTKNDWRNIIPRKELAGEDVHFIKIARALYSQYDAHIDNKAKELFMIVSHFERSDCTHWVAPSGIFHYILTIIYNTISDIILESEQ